MNQFAMMAWALVALAVAAWVQLLKGFGLWRWLGAKLTDVRLGRLH